MILVLMKNELFTLMLVEGPKKDQPTTKPGDT